MNVADTIKGIIRARHFLKSDAPVSLRSLVTHTTKAVEENGGFEIEVFATTDGIDLDSEVVAPDGGDMSYLSRNRKVFVDHEYGLSDVGATLRWINRSKDGKGWRMRARLVKSSPHYAMIRELAETDTIGASIGLEAMDFGPPTDEEQKAYPSARSVVRKWRALEVSFTAMPMNVECQSSAFYRDESAKKRYELAVKNGKVTCRYAMQKPRILVVGGKVLTLSCN